MAERSISLRIAVTNADQAIRTLKSLGPAGEEALARLTTGAQKASAALDTIEESGRKAGRGIDFQGVSFQLQDVVVQAQAGTSAFVVLGQQGPALASALFGPVGAGIGLVVAGVAALTGVIFSLSGETRTAESASRDLADALSTAEGNFFSAAKGADELRTKLAALSAEQRQVELNVLRADISSVNKARVEQGKSLSDTLSGNFAAEIQGARILSRRERQPEDPAERQRIADLVRLGDIINRFRDAEGTVADALDARRILDQYPALIEGQEEVANQLARQTKEAAEAEAKVKELNAQLAVAEGRSTKAQEALLAAPTGTAAADNARKEAEAAEREAARARERVAAETKRASETAAREAKAARDREAREAKQTADQQAREAKQAQQQKDREELQRAREEERKSAEWFKEYNAIFSEADREIDEERRARQEAFNAFMRQKAEEQAEILLGPFEDFGNRLSGIFDQAFDDLVTTGKVRGRELLEALTGASQEFGGGFLKNLLAQPLKDAFAQFQGDLKANLQGGGSLFGSFSSAFNEQNRLGKVGIGAGVGAGIGGIAGGLGAGLTGNPNVATGASIGGALGGGLGSLFGPIGSIAGGLLGSAGGGLLGSLFGGDELANDRANLTFTANRGIVYEDKSSSPENKSIVNKLAGQLQEATDILRKVGASFGSTGFAFAAGNETGIEYQHKEYASPEAALAAAIADLAGAAKVSGDKNLSTVLRNTKAGSAQELGSDIDFARQFAELSGKIGPAGKALRDLNEGYKQAELRAKELGLSTKGLYDEWYRLEEQIKDRGIRELKILTGEIGVLGQGMAEIADTFEVANRNARDLGFSESKLADARKRAEADLKATLGRQLTELLGGNSAFQQGVADIQERFKQATALGKELGKDTTSYRFLEQQQIRLLREDFERQYQSLIGGSSELEQAIAGMREQFRQASDIGKQLGKDVSGLAKTLAERERELVAAREQSLNDQLRGQVGQLRGFFDQLIDPLKNALANDNFGSPEAQLRSTVSLFRKNAALARGGDVEAIQSLAGLRDQALGLARDFQGSGSGFADLRRELNSTVAELARNLETQRDAALRDLPTVMRENTAQIVDGLRTNIDRVVLELAELRRDFRLYGTGGGSLAA